MSRNLLLDSNLLCLLVVGRVSRGAIASHPRLKTFDHDDLATLIAILDRFTGVKLCPHVLAETSNLLAFRQSANQQATWLISMREVLEQAGEIASFSKSGMADAAYHRLGLTDAMMLTLAQDQNLTLLSDDLPLHIEAGRRGLPTINYNYLRDGALRIEEL